MRVILFRRPDGGCSVVRPAPEMFNPNSRTIRLLEASGFMFPAVRKILEIDQARGQALEKKYLTQFSEVAAEAENIGLDLMGSKAEAVAERRTALIASHTTEAEAFQFHCKAVEAKRENHPDFVLDEFIENAWTFIIAKTVPLGAEWRYADSDSEFPDRDYRDAWHADDTGTVVIDMVKAREIHRENIRLAREPLFQRLDIEYIRADEPDNGLTDESRAKTKKDIAARKRALRDAPKNPEIDKAETPEALKAIWPEGLER